MKLIRQIFIGMVLVGSGASLGQASESASNGLNPETTRIEDSITYATTGCGGAVLRIPQPGTQFASDSLDLPDSARSFYQVAAEHNVQWLSSIECEHTGRTHALVPAASKAVDQRYAASIVNSYVSSNWSGYQSNHTARFVQGAYTVPAVSNPVPGYSNTGYYSSTWSGIGGGFGANTSDPLIQSGTAQDVNGTVKTYYHWYEVVHGPSDTGGEVKITSLAAHAGDFVAAISVWISTTNQAEMGICNLTTGVCVQSYVPNTPAPGASTEWIVEAPSNGGILPLANFNSVSWTDVCWASAYTPGVTVSCGALTSPQKISLQTNVLGGYQTIASPGAMAANGNFTDYYQQPHQVPTCGTPGHPPCP